MLYLFPMEYWIILAIAASGRFISGQVLSWRLAKLNSNNRYKQIVTTVVSRPFRMFLRFNGVAHLLLILGLVAMFYITYQYIVPINAYSSQMLRIVRAIGNILVVMEVVNALLALGITTFIVFKK